MRIAFLGNHTVGVVVLKILLQESDVVAVIAHPFDPEDGTRYRSVYNFAVEHDLSAIRAKGKDEQLERFIEDRKPDLLWITDYRYLVPENIISLTPLGAINLHPSLLPKYRGRAPINWAIINGETNLGLTAHLVDDGMDTGDIIYQESFFLSQDQDVGDALKILYPLYGLITQKVLKAFESGNIPRRSQNHLAGTVFSKRIPADGLIDFTSPAISVWNLIRAVSRPYPGAFSYLNGKKIFLWKAQPSEIHINAGTFPGSIQKVDSRGFHIQCGDGPLCITDFSFEGKKQTITANTFLSAIRKCE
jgi:methionyl-tRNA formyltransferase